MSRNALDQGTPNLSQAITPMSHSPVITAKVKLPSFGRSAACPELPAQVYRDRLAKAIERLRFAQLDTLVVYGDREPAANLEYLTGFDPRFEEALLLLSAEW